MGYLACTSRKLVVVRGTATEAANGELIHGRRRQKPNVCAKVIAERTANKTSCFCQCTSCENEEDEIGCKEQGWASVEAETSTQRHTGEGKGVPESAPGCGGANGTPDARVFLGEETMVEGRREGGGGESGGVHEERRRRSRKGSRPWGGLPEA